MNPQDGLDGTMKHAHQTGKKHRSKRLVGDVADLIQGIAEGPLGTMLELNVGTWS